MEKNNKCCIEIVKWQLFWEKEKVVKRKLLWDGGTIRLDTQSMSWLDLSLKNVKMVHDKTYVSFVHFDVGCIYKDCIMLELWRKYLSSKSQNGIQNQN